MTEYKKAQDELEELATTITKTNQDLSHKDDLIVHIEKYEDLLKNKSKTFSDELISQEKSDISDFGPETSRLINKSIVFRLFLKNYQEIDKKDFPQKVLEYLKEDFLKVLDLTYKSDIRFLTFRNYQFLAYLEILSFKRFPVGTQNISFSGFSRSALLKQSRSNAMRLFLILLKVKGNKPFFELHLNPHRIRKFNIEGWKEVLSLSSGMLKKFPDVKGLFGSAWFFDPKIEEISPELSYIRELLQEAGGKFFIAETTENDIKNALFMSKTRKKAFDDGHYQPTSYMVILSRDALNSFNEYHVS